MRIGVGVSLPVLATAIRDAGAPVLPSVTFTAASFSTLEGNSGAKVLAVTATRSSTTGAVTATVALTPGSLSASDFTGGVLPSGLTFSWADGQATASLSPAISFNGDTAVEPDETGTLTMTAPTGYSAGAIMSATITALNDDSSAVAGSSPTDFTATGIVPTLHYHIPAGSTVTTVSGTHPQLGTYAAASNIADIKGNQDATNASGAGPIVLTDGLGRKFLRFTTPAGGTGADHGGPNGPNYLDIAAAGATASIGSRNVTSFMVGRLHRAGTCYFVSFNANPPGGPIIGTQPGNSGGSPFVRSGSRYSSAPLSGDASRTLIGSQMQVVGAASRTGTQGTANGGCRQYVNTDAVMNQSLTNTTTTTGLRIGDTASAMYFDLYELIVVVGQVTDAQADAIAAAMVANWSIASITDQLVLEGDSITAGIVSASDTNAANGVLEGWGPSMVLTDPGALLVPATTRVINQGASGNAVSDLVGRKAATGNVWTTGKLAGGRNVVAVQIGRNNWTTSATSGTDVYQQLTGTGTYTATGLFKNTANTGYLDFGWEVAAGINIACSASVDAGCQAQRSAMRAASFLTDCSAGAGQTYDGKLKRLELALIEHSGAQRFNTNAQASDLTYFQADVTHPTPFGTKIMASGGDTPQYGLRGALL